MARRVDLTGENVTRKNRKERNYGTKTDLASTVVERGSTHWAEGSNVNIDGFLGVAGTMTVSGVLSVTGTFNASGSINLSGSTSVTGPLVITGTTTIGGNTNITGELNVTGPTTLDGILDIGGNTTVSGTLDIQGRTTIKNDLELLTGGIFKAGVTKIEPNGKATFGSFIIDPASPRLIQAPGGWLFSNGPGSIGLADSGTSSVNLNSSRAELVYGNTSRLVADSAGISLTGPSTSVSGNLKVTGSSELVGRADLKGQLDVAGFTWLRGAGLYFPGIPTTAFPPNLHITSTGQVFRSSWTPPA